MLLDLDAGQRGRADARSPRTPGERLAIGPFQPHGHLRGRFSPNRILGRCPLRAERSCIVGIPGLHGARVLSRGRVAFLDLIQLALRTARGPDTENVACAGLVCHGSDDDQQNRTSPRRAEQFESFPGCGTHQGVTHHDFVDLGAGDTVPGPLLTIPVVPDQSIERKRDSHRRHHCAAPMSDGAYTCPPLSVTALCSWSPAQRWRAAIDARLTTLPAIARGGFPAA